MNRLAATLGPRSQTKKLSRKDYTGVDIAKTCNVKFITVFIPSVFDFVADAQTFWTRLSLSEKPVVQTTSTKAPKEVITHAVAEDVSMTNDQLLSGLLEDLLATPEDPRRISKSISSRVPSLEPISGSVSLPFEGVDALAGYGLGDLVPWGSSVETMEDFKHGLHSMGEVEVPADLPQDVQIRQPKTKKPRVKRPQNMKDLIDEETVLEKDELLLGPGEGLLPKTNVWVLDLYKYFSSPENKKKRKEKLVPEEPRGLESGLFDWDMLDAPPLNEGLMIGGDFISSSVAGGSPIPRSLGKTSIGGTSSPMARMDWNVPTQITYRADSLDFLGEIVMKAKHIGNVSFKELVKGQRRQEVARNFHKILNLATGGSIRVDQAEAFGTIVCHVSGARSQLASGLG